jgi:hypothetical protein
MAELYGGMATSAFRVAPTALSAAGPPLPRWRYRDGKPQVHYVPVKSSETIRYGDFLKITANSSDDEVERALDPAGTDATATLTGDGGGIPRYVSLQTITSAASMTHKDVIAVYDITDLEFLFRLYHVTAATAGPDNVKVIDQPRIRVTSTAISAKFYEWGIYEIGTASDNYFPIVDVASQDDTNGGVAITEIPTESGATENFAPVYVVFGGLS